MTDIQQSLQDAIFTRLDAVAAKLGVAAGHIWPVLVRQARVDGVRDVVTGCTLALAAYYLGKLTRYLYSVFKGNYIDDYTAYLAICPHVISRPTRFRRA
jgi:hypothetical protein